MTGSMSFLDGFITATFLGTIKDISPLYQTSLLCFLWWNLSEVHSPDKWRIKKFSLILEKINA